MADVHEITRKAFKELANGPRWHDESGGYGDYVVIGSFARFGGTPYTFFEIEHYDTEYWACSRCDGMNYNALYGRRLYSDFLDSWDRTVGYYEVWHIVDDADDVAETLESLRQLREAGALDGIKPVHDDVTAHVTEGGKPRNWHIQYSFVELKSEGICGDRAVFIKNFMWEHRHCGSPLYKCLSSYLDYFVELYELVDDYDNEETYHADKGSINCNSLDEAYSMAARLSSMPCFSKVEILVWIHNCETTDHLVLYQFEKKRGQVNAYAEFGCHLLDIDVPESISGIAVELDYIPF